MCVSFYVFLHTWYTVTESQRSLKNSCYINLNDLNGRPPFVIEILLTPGATSLQRRS